MKKTVLKQRLLIRIMKITLFQFVLALVFSSVTTNNIRGQKNWTQGNYYRDRFELRYCID
jgi:hypothetical protein